MSNKWNVNQWTRTNDKTMQQFANVERTGPNSFRMSVMDPGDKRIDPTRKWIPIHKSQFLYPLDDLWIGRILQDWSAYTGQQIWNGITPLTYEVCFYSLYEPFRATGKFINPHKNYRFVFNKQVKSAL